MLSGRGGVVYHVVEAEANIYRFNPPEDHVLPAQKCSSSSAWEFVRT